MGDSVVGDLLLQKKFNPKNYFAIWTPIKFSFWAKLFEGALFTKVKCTTLKSVWKDGCLIPHPNYSNQKSFNLIVGSMFTFFKMETTQYFGQQFVLQTGLRLSSPLQNFMPYILCSGHWADSGSKYPKYTRVLWSAKSPLQELTTVDGTSIWAGDGVHLTSNASRVAAQKLMQHIAMERAGGEPANKRARLESVIPTQAAPKPLKQNIPPPPTPKPVPPPLWLSGQLPATQRGRGTGGQHTGPQSGGQGSRGGHTS